MNFMLHFTSNVIIFMYQVKVIFDLMEISLSTDPQTDTTYHSTPFPQANTPPMGEVLKQYSWYNRHCHHLVLWCTVSTTSVVCPHAVVLSSLPGSKQAAFTLVQMVPNKPQLWCSIASNEYQAQKH